MLGTGCLRAGCWIGAVSLHWGGIVPHGVGDCQLKSGCGARG